MDNIRFINISRRLTDDAEFVIEIRTNSTLAVDYLEDALDTFLEMVEAVDDFPEEDKIKLGDL